MCSPLTKDAVRKGKEQVEEILKSCHPSSNTKKQKGVNNPVGAVRNGTQPLTFLLLKTETRHCSPFLPQSLHTQRVSEVAAPSHQATDSSIPLHRFPEETGIKFLPSAGENSQLIEASMKPSPANWPWTCASSPLWKLENYVKMLPQVLTYTYAARVPSEFGHRCFSVQESWLFQVESKELIALCIYANMYICVCFHLKKSLIYLNEFSLNFLKFWVFWFLYISGMLSPRLYIPLLTECLRLFQCCKKTHQYL